MASFRRFPGSWRRLGDVPFERTALAFETVARAAHVLGASAGHVGLAWRDDGSALVTAPPSGGPVFALRPSDLAVLVLAGEGRVPNRMFLDRRSPVELAAWVHHALGTAPAGGPPEGDLAFDASDRAALSEAGRWLNNADDVFDHAGLQAHFDARSGRFSTGTARTGVRIVLETLPLPAFVVESGDHGTPSARLEAREIVQLPASLQTARVASFLDRATGLSAWER